MSMVRDVLTVLSREGAPVTAGEIRACCPGDPVAQSVHGALNALCTDGRAERLAEAGQRGTYVITDFGKQWLAAKGSPAPKATKPDTPPPAQAPVPKSPDAAPAPAPKLAATVKPKPDTTTEAPAAPAATSRADERKLMRQAAILLIEASEDRPLTTYARSVIHRLIEVAA